MWDVRKGRPVCSSSSMNDSLTNHDGWCTKRPPIGNATQSVCKMNEMRSTTNIKSICLTHEIGSYSVCLCYPIWFIDILMYNFCSVAVNSFKYNSFNLILCTSVCYKNNGKNNILIHMIVFKMIINGHHWRWPSSPPPPPPSACLAHLNYITFLRERAHIHIHARTNRPIQHAF